MKSSTRLPRIQNFIGGKLISPASNLYIDNWNPATGKVYSQTPDSDERDVGAAVAAAEKAFPEWSRTAAERRAELLRQFAYRIERQAPALAKAESLDTGKPLSLAALLDIPRSALNFRFFADAVTQFSTEAHATGELALNYTLRRPLGVVGCISPWNLPLYLLTWKIAPALAMGNCVVAKPSEITPTTAYLLSRIAQEIGLPPGVLNIVHGTGPKVGSPLVRHSRVAAVSFTGSTKTGADIANATAASFKKLSLEMGGKNPTLVFADCDFERTVHECVRAAFSNQGQICLCGSRILVERPIYERFKKAFVQKTKALKIGDPAKPVDQGALVSKAHFDKVSGYIELAKKEGGKILCGGRPASVSGRCHNGWFFEPTVIEGLPAECRVNQEEIFGPVATLLPFQNDDEAVRLANSTRYGLAASLWTSSVRRAHWIAARLDSGIVWINCWMLRDLRTPFGGMKDSGLGREGGFEALRFFSEPKNVCVKL